MAAGPDSAKGGMGPSLRPLVWFIFNTAEESQAAVELTRAPWLHYSVRWGHSRRARVRSQSKLSGTGITNSDHSKGVCAMSEVEGMNVDVDDKLVSGINDWVLLGKSPGSVTVTSQDLQVSAALELAYLAVSCADIAVVTFQCMLRASVLVAAGRSVKC